MSPLVQWIVILWLGCTAAVVLWMIAQIDQPWTPATHIEAWVRYPERLIEETRLMPGADQRDREDDDPIEQVPEGLGLVPPPYLGRRWIVNRGHVDRAAPSHVHNAAPIDASLQRALEELEREAQA